jgi:hypothetical protein
LIYSVEAPRLSHRGDAIDLRKLDIFVVFFHQLRQASSSELHLDGINSLSEQPFTAPLLFCVLKRLAKRLNLCICDAVNQLDDVVVLDPLRRGYPRPAKLRLDL